MRKIRPFGIKKSQLFVLVSSLSCNKKGPRPIVQDKSDTRSQKANETHADSINLFNFILIIENQQHREKNRDFCRHLTLIEKDYFKHRLCLYINWN